MLSDQDKKYWKGVEERDHTAQFEQTLGVEFPELPVLNSDQVLEMDLSRRSFLRAAGFALASSGLGACSRSPVEKAIPLLVGTEGGVVGETVSYASTCRECPAGCGILATTRDGRPIKLEGNPDHPLSQGGICAVGQAGLLGLYDSHRLGTPLEDGRPVNWSDLDDAVVAALEQTETEIVILTGTLNSPTTLAQIERFKTRFPNSRHVQYDSVSYSSILEAHLQTHGLRVVPCYFFDRARLIVSFDADFLGTWISPVQFTRDYMRGRDLQKPVPASFSHHIQLESRLSLTGSNADRRIRVSPREESRILMGLAQALALKAGVELPWQGAGEEQPGIELVAELADQLWTARGQSLVVTGRNDVSHQRLANLINHLLQNYGATLSIDRPSYQSQSDDRVFSALVEEMQEGHVGALIVAGVDPAHSVHRPIPFAEALREVALTVCLSRNLTETATGCRFVCPENHYLESWGDSRLTAGLLGLSQPTIPKLGETRSLAECLSAWTGSHQEDLQMIRAQWRDDIFPQSAAQSDFDDFWVRAVQAGFVRVDAPSGPGPRFDLSALEPLPRDPEPGDGRFSLVLYRKIQMLDGSQAGNPWLQELPDPVTKVTWDNYVSLAPEVGERLQIAQGDVLRITQGTRELELPALLQVGQHPEVVAIAVGYGSRLSERFAGIGPDWLEAQPTIALGGRVGKNAFVLAPAPGLLWSPSEPVRLEKTGRIRTLALTQTHHNIEVPEHLGGHRRDLVRETTYQEFLEDPSSGNPALGHPLQLWPQDHVYEGRHWAMAIDLSRCTGCSACVVACQAENNVPVVGKDEVERRREMHWIRIDRYYSGSEQSPEVLYQPVMCQHCDHAPCEAVCPVLATVHSEEGINQQIYNRCVGTRYCANNCPYKVRRFNWFDYWKAPTREHLALNPDITTRMRGVMEKCSLCTQRIQKAKFEAKRQGRELVDGEIQTACQQSCPSRAIVFGDQNDPESEVSRLIAGGRHYRLLEEMNFRPSVGYLTKVRNKA